MGNAPFALNQDSLIGPISGQMWTDTLFFPLGSSESDSLVSSQASSDTVQVALEQSTISPAAPVRPKIKASYNAFYADYKLSFQSTDLVRAEPSTLNHPRENSEQLRSAEWNSSSEQVIEQLLPIRPQEQVSNDWIVLLLIISISGVGLIRLQFGKLLQKTFRAAIFQKEAYSLFLDRNSTSNKVSFVLNGLFFLNFSLFLFLALEQSQALLPALTRPIQYLMLVGVLLSFLILKALIYYVSAYLFDSNKLVAEYVYNSSVYNRVAGIFILPIIAILPFMHPRFFSLLTYFGVGIFLITYLWQLLRGAQIISKNKSSLLYSFLYLCSVEILPLLLGFKWISNQLVS